MIERERTMNKMRKWINSSVWSIALTFVMGGVANADYEAIEVPNGGTITGTVKFIGIPPKIETLAVTKNEDICGKTVAPRVLEVNRLNKGLKNTVVYLENIEKGRAPATKPTTLHMGFDENRPASILCDFEEHIVVITTQKTEMSFVSFDAVLHTARAVTKKGQEFFKVPLPNEGQVIKKTVRIRGKEKAPEIGMWMVCDSHPFMSGYVFVLPHDYVALTDRSGRFTITDVPPGKHRLVAWHEGYMLQVFNSENRPVYEKPHVMTKEVEVNANAEIKADFKFSVEKAQE